MSLQQVTADVAYNLGHGGCRFNYTSATQVTLSPYNGNLIQIAGSMYQIPSAGINGSNSGLSADTLYYVYLYNNSGTLTLFLSATAPTTDTTAGNIGVQILTGNNAYSLVGMIYTNASSQFQFAIGANSTPVIGVLSYFKRRTLCAWNNTGGNYADLAVGVDGSPDSSTTSNYYSITGTENLCMFAQATFGLTQGNHFATVYGLVNSTATTAHITAQPFVTVRG